MDMNLGFGDEIEGPIVGILDPFHVFSKFFSNISTYGASSGVIPTTSKALFPKWQFSIIVRDSLGSKTVVFSSVELTCGVTVDPTTSLLRVNGVDVSWDILLPSRVAKEVFLKDQQSS